MKYASVCSGVEAASLAWMPLGWEAAWFSEIDPFPCAVLKERFPTVPNLGDMTKIKMERMENESQKFTGSDGSTVIVPGRVDLLVGGTPCQGFSCAGKHGGLHDERSSLCLSYIRLLDAVRPRWFVFENVPGVFSTNGGKDFRSFLSKIDEIGYSASWTVLDAQYIRVPRFPRAVPQRRRRVFVVGHIGGWRGPAEVLFEQKNVDDMDKTYEPPTRKNSSPGLCGVATLCCNAEMIPDCAPCLVESADSMYAGFTDGKTFRRYTPVECERLMGFPDNWTRISWKGKPEEECPDGLRYKACGNSMCVNVMSWLGMRIDLVDRKFSRY